MGLSKSAAPACGLAEGLLAARDAGSLPPDGKEVLMRHLASCADCQYLARDLDASDAFTAGTEQAPPELALVSRENYQRGREIGRGGMGRVLIAWDRRLGRAVAIKEPLDARMQSLLEREARLTARLQHPGIVSVHEAGRWPSGEPFYAMKYIAGRPLDQAIAKQATLAQRLALLPRFTAVAEAIAYAHGEGVIHRDLKPSNILVGSFGETVVIDWGLAKDLRSEGDGETGAAPGAGSGPLTLAGAGTAAYMAPEQARGEPPSERVDIYALGATLHHLVAGGPPGQAELPAEAPTEVCAIVRKAMAPVCADRYRSAGGLVDELRRFQTGQVGPAHRYSRSARACRGLHRRRSALIGVAAFARRS
jgi:eukaryotic-like serine/threonine-protein kinase